LTIISPSILSCNFLKIQEELDVFKNIDNLWFHLDVMDGHFVPNLTFGHPIIKQLCTATNKPLDAHLMVTNPEFYIDTLKDYGLHNLTFHVEATKEPLQLLKKTKKYFNSGGISIRPKTNISDIDINLLKEIDLILLMSVEPGFGGQIFIENTWQKLTELMMFKKNNNAHFQIQVDGGVNNKNSKKLIEQGVDNLVAGSFIFSRSPQDYSQLVESLRN